MNDGQGAAIGQMMRAAADGRLPALEPVAERFAFLLATGLRSLGADGVEAGAPVVRPTLFGAAMAMTGDGTLAGIARLAGEDGRIVVLLDGGPAAVVFATLLGGGPAEGRAGLGELTPIERRMARDLIGRILQLLADALAPLAPVGFEVDQVGAGPAAAMVAPKTAAAVEIVVPIRAGEVAGDLRLVLPVPSLAPLRQAWARRRLGDTHDAAWGAALQQALAPVELTAQAVFSEVQTTLAEILAWRVGDTVALPAGDPDQAHLAIGGQVLFRGTIGHSRGARAVRIAEAVSAPAAPGAEAA